LLTLDGPLGAGKSAVVRALLRAAGVAGPVPSPTFTLLEPYEVAGLGFRHLDLYRIAQAEELALLGYEDGCRAGVLRLVEWSARLQTALGPADLHLALRYDGVGRALTLTGPGLTQSLAYDVLFG
jgi:tRNA threonylcarbamoyladenosine biosynthesis protein TsaE